MAMTKPLGTQVDFSSGDLSIDTNTLHVDSTNNNVGIGTSAPLGKLKVAVGDNAPAASGYMNTGVVFESALASRAINIGVNNTAGYSWINAAFANNSGIPDNLALMTGATERMRIDSSGRVTMPYQPGFRSGTSTFNATTGIATSYATSSSSTGGMYFNYRNSGHFNTSTGRFTAPVSGKYLIQATYSDSDSVERREIGWLFINGSNRGEWVESWGQYDNSSNCIIEYLTANDYVEFARHPAYPYDGVVASVDLLG